MSTTPKERINDLALSFLLSSAIHAAAELGIADALVEKSPQTLKELSDKLKVDSRSLFRLLRFLVSHQIFSQNSDGTFSLNPESSYLAENHPESIRHVLLVNKGPRWNAFGAIKESVHTGRPGFDELYGKTYYEYLDNDSEAAKRFNAHMTTYTQEEDKLIAPLLPLEKAKTLIDIGGGEGQFLNEVLKHFQEVHGTLFDLESTVSNLKITLPKNRWESLGGDFFKSKLPNVDVYVLKRVLHNWKDEDCLSILKNVRQAMGKESKLLIIEGVVPEDTSRHFSKDTDLFLMTLFAGCERTANEFDLLAQKSNLQITRIFPTSTFLSIIELCPNTSL
jgi:hypothetical protein